MSTPAVQSRYPEKVRLAFARKGLTITRIASRLGKSKSTISLLLRGKLRAASTARRVADLLGISVADLGIPEQRTPGRQQPLYAARRQPEKGSREAILSALSSPARCNSEDVLALQEQIASGALLRSDRPIVHAERKRK